MNYIGIIIGGGIGAVLRYLSTQAVQQLFFKNLFPLGTLLVNTVGALLIGFFFTTFESLTVPAGLRLFVITGFLGGFTTFSTYSLETVRFFINGNIKQGLLNILLNNGICILFVLLGIAASKLLMKK